MRKTCGTIGGYLGSGFEFRPEFCANYKWTSRKCYHWEWEHDKLTFESFVSKASMLAKLFKCPAQYLFKEISRNKNSIGLLLWYIFPLCYHIFRNSTSTYFALQRRKINWLRKWDTRCCSPSLQTHKLCLNFSLKAKCLLSVSLNECWVKP